MIELIKQPNSWSCGLASLAMVSGFKMETIVDAIGHDGSEIIDPIAKEPLCRRSFSIDEFQDFLLRYWMALIPINARPEIGDTGIDVYANYEDRLNRYLDSGYKGLLEGCYALDKPHMVAYEDSIIYNPTGPVEEKLEESNFAIETFWILKDIK